MSKTLSQAASRAGRRWSAIALMLLACLIIAGCAHRSGSSGENRPDGFYGGISTGGEM